METLSPLHITSDTNLSRESLSPENNCVKIGSDLVASDNGHANSEQKKPEINGTSTEATFTENPRELSPVNVEVVMDDDTKQMSEDDKETD